MAIPSRTNWRAYLFVAPATIYVGLFSLAPLIVALYASLHRWHLLRPERPFVGLDNYADLIASPSFQNAVKNTIVFSMLSVPAGMAVALAVALLVSRELRGIAVFRTLYYIPAVASQVAVSMVWIWVLLPEVGLINFILIKLGFRGDTDFLKTHAMASLVAISVWIGLGPRMVIFLAGLQGIPGDLYEAATLDGASAWQRFRHITLPMLVPTTLFVLVTSTIASFQLFTPIYIMTKGGPGRSTDMVVFHIYKEAWHQLQIGRASAASYLMFVVIMLISLVQFRLMRRRAQDITAAW